MIPAEKSDLEAYRVAFEHYYEDNHCYPSLTDMSMCGSETLKPYLPKVMCDPVKAKPYTYSVNGCTSYKIFTNLANTGDPDIARVGCAEGCGPSESTDFNYGISSQNVRVGIPTAPGGTGGDAGGDGSEDNGAHVTPNCTLQANGTWNCTCTPGASCGLGCPGNTVCGSDGKYCIVDPIRCPL